MNLPTAMACACHSHTALRPATGATAPVDEARVRAKWGQSFPVQPMPGQPPDPWLAAALAIGQELVAQARPGPAGLGWQGDDLVGDDADSTRIVRGDMGVGLYAGSAGIAWFLVHLGQHVRDTAMLQLGLQALADAVVYSRACLAADTLSLYGGASGVALLALQAAQRTQSAGLAAEAQTLLSQVAGMVQQGEIPQALDLIGGSAGVAVALCAALRQLGHRPQTPACRARCLAACRSLALRLRSSAFRSWNGAHWPDPQAEQGTPGLCGLAHGNAGIAWALFEVADARAEPAWAGLAEEALRYERSWFDPASATWPDLRGSPQQAAWPGTMTAWCHGGIGIAAMRLQRLQRLQASGRPACPAMWAEVGAALQALRAVAGAARRSLDAGQPLDASLCHGLGGAVELFNLAHGLTGLAEHGRAARRTAQWCLEVPALNGGRWSNGLRGAQQVPGLMAGSSGIGAMLLRLHAPAAIGSPLLPGHQG